MDKPLHAYHAARRFFLFPDEPWLGFFNFSVADDPAVAML